MQAAVAEAAFMTGLERNSEVVQLAAYAPLFVHANFVNWPTNLIVIDNHRRGSVGAPHLCASLDSRGSVASSQPA